MARARQPPAGRRTFLKGLLGLGVGALTGTAAYGYAYERHRVAVTRADLAVPRLPPGLAGFRIALLTDVHRSETVDRPFVERAVDLALDAAPDLVVLGGDFVSWADRRYMGDVAEALGRLWAPHGVFAVLGNHDDDRVMPAALARNGVTVLRDARARLVVSGERLDLIGLRYWTRDPESLARIARGAAPGTILLAHDPRRLRAAAGLGIPLVLSGHTHGGQVLVPGLGAIAARKFPVVYGTGRDRDTVIFVSRGIGTVYVPVRFNCPPEVAVLTLRPYTTPAGPGRAGTGHDGSETRRS